MVSLPRPDASCVRAFFCPRIEREMPGMAPALPSPTLFQIESTFSNNGAAAMARPLYRGTV